VYGNPRVNIGNVIYSGEYLDGSRTSVLFRGLPYAEPPVGDLRWQPPQSIQPSPVSEDNAVMPADAFSPVCPQGDGNVKWYRTVATAFANADASTVEAEPISEDCLYLNIWSTNFQQESKQPVMVWIHGGGNQTGWAFEPNYRGANLAAKGVVVVSINYRLGPFGFLAHPLLSGESTLGISGNYGLLDQIAALRWVANHIEQFGGDPGRITLFGESAGAADIAYLILSPLAEGLFHRAISQSGGYLLKNTQALQQEESMGVKLAELLQIANDDRALINMRGKSPAEILAAAGTFAATHSFNVNIDGTILPDRPARMLRQGNHNRVDLMIGSNANEWSMYVKDELTYDELLDDIAVNYKQDAEQLKALLHPDDAKVAMDQLYTSSEMLCTSKYIATRMSEKNQNVYHYHFTRIRPGAGGEKLKAYHGAEIPYVFDNHDSWLPTDSVDVELTEFMISFWAEFAKTGDPNNDDLPIWPALGPAKNYLEFGNRLLIGRNLAKDVCAIMERRLDRNAIPD
jgi:para-nitrobenzyl esterase|tara:strand:- start:10258 stop:11802 length:1545 start_codon:yes stop_codon:yes gene_type:complete